MVKEAGLKAVANQSQLASYIFVTQDNDMGVIENNKDIEKLFVVLTSLICW